MRRVLVTPRSFSQGNSEPFEILEAAGYEVVLNPYGRIMTKEEMIQWVPDIEGIIIGVDPLDRDVLAHATNLKAISKYGVGTDNIDLETAKFRNIPVSVTAGANTNAVADFALALMLSVARRVTVIDRQCRQLDWGKISAIGMWGKTLGLIGLGNIGKAVVRRASGFNMRILAYDTVEDSVFANAYSIEYVDFEYLLSRSDFISLHVPLTEETRHMIGREEFDKMKSHAIVINTARGGLIDEDALCETLSANRIWGAGIDVFDQEPPANEKLLLKDNLVIGSHCAASTIEAVGNMRMAAAKNLVTHLSPNSVINQG